MKSFAQQLAFYSVFHENRLNVWIHIICVPIIAYGLLTAMSLLQFADWQIGPVRITLASAYFLLIIGYFWLLDFTFAFIGTLFYGAILVASDLTASHFDTQTTVIIASTTFVGAFILQFIGHGVWEKKRPALADNLVQAFLSAPFFILVDLAFELGLKKKLQQEIAEAVKSDPVLRKISTK